jgi:nicotinamide riboside transporter PnuC
MAYVTFTYTEVAIGTEMTVMYFFVCRVIAQEIMPKAKGGRLLLIFWVLGVVIFGTLMQRTEPDSPLFSAAIFVAPFTAVLAMLLAQNR